MSEPTLRASARRPWLAGFTWALLSTLADNGFAAPVLPATTLTAITLGAVLAGTMAAALPARRASRMAVLDAVRAA